MPGIRVIVPYTRVHPKTASAILHYAPRAEMVDTSNMPTDYWMAIQAAWTGNQDFVLIEHDIEIHADVIRKFESCTHLWCTYPYHLSAGDDYLREGLGCVRFSADVQRMVSPQRIMDSITLDLPPWAYLDTKVSHAMKDIGVEVHQHWPPVRHHNPNACADDCCAEEYQP